MSDYPSPYEASDQFDGWYNNQILANDEEGEVTAAALPPGWEEMRDSRSGRAYYVDHENQITTWDRPTNNVDSPDADVDNDVMDMGVPNARGESSMQEESVQEESVQEETVHETVEGQTSNPNNNDDKVHPSNDWQSTTTTRMPPLDESHEQHQHQQPNDEEITEEEVVAYCPRVVVNPSDKWEKNFEDLKAYKQLHGTTCVPQKEGTLGRWVNNVRQFYSKRNKGEKTNLTDERVKALEEIGFVWKLKSSGKRKTQEKKEKAPKKKSKQTKTGIKESNKSKKAKKSSSATNNVSTKMLDDGTQVIESEEKQIHPDGSTAEITTEESINKRTIRLADGKCILETTTKIVTTKIERIVLPTLLSEQLVNTEKKQSVENDVATLQRVNVPREHDELAIVTKTDTKKQPIEEETTLAV